MHKYKYTVIASTEIPDSFKGSEIWEGLINILNLTRVLYDIQNVNKGDGVNVENYFYGKIVSTIESMLPYLDEDVRDEVYSRLQTVSDGSFDVIRIPFNSDSGRTDLLFGKIISPENNNEKMYGSAAGFPNIECDNAVKEYDSKVEDYLSRSNLAGFEGSLKLTEMLSDFSCMDVAMLSGELDRNNKPISVFYSRDQGENISALSRVTLFTNLYFHRFELLSKRLGRKYISGFDSVDNFSEDIINRVLLFWLRGHDNGHSIGEDNLGQFMKKDKRFKYYALHELKSDIISLYLLSEVDSLWGEIKIPPGIIYKVFVSEALRYIRRGNPDRIPDTASAHMVINYFLDYGAVSYSSDKVLFNIDDEQLKNAISELCGLMLKIFIKGDHTSAIEFYDKYIEFNSDDVTKFKTDTEIPFFIDMDPSNNQ